jgi:hypothetical protein
MIGIKRISGLMLISLSFAILLVTAFVYEQQSNTVTQTITEVASITLDQGTLGNIEEGETILYTPTNTSALNQILDITTGKDGVYLHFNTDLDGAPIDDNYATYRIEVIADTVPTGSSISVGNTITTLTIASPDTVATLDLAGDWIFDFQITTTADQVTSDTPTTANIIVSAESTS